MGDDDRVEDRDGHERHPRTGEHRWSWTGDVPADDVVRVGTLQAAAPPFAPAVVTLELTLAGDGHEPVTNRYAAPVTRTSP